MGIHGVAALHFEPDGARLLYVAYRSDVETINEAHSRLKLARGLSIREAGSSANQIVLIWNPSC